MRDHGLFSAGFWQVRHFRPAAAPASQKNASLKANFPGVSTEKRVR
jgi:hypothetical protein